MKIVELDGYRLRMTEPRQRVLAQIVGTNGGGICYEAQTAGWKRAADYLIEEGLIQGKKGQLHRTVHTRDGLKVARELKETL